MFQSMFITKAYAVWGDGGAGWAQLPYLIKILGENYKRYQQIKTMIDQAKNQKQYLELINSGIDGSIGLLDSMPVKDERLLSDLRTFKKSFNTVSDLYGKIPKSKEALVQMLHDQTVAESLRMINDFKDFAVRQDENSTLLLSQGKTASPKGAQRMTVESNAMILKTMSQMMKLDAQNLKLQSELLAMKNKEKKQNVANYQKVNTDFGNAFKNFKPQKGFVKF